jgi:hypothetical protein
VSEGSSQRVSAVKSFFFARVAFLLRCFGGRGDLAKSGDECFRFGLSADGDAHEIGHGGEAAADQNIFGFKLVDESLDVGAHIDHYEIRMRGNEGAAVVGECVAEPSAGGDETVAAGGDILVIGEAG